MKGLIFFQNSFLLRYIIFGTTHGYAPIYLGKLIIFFDTISCCNLHS